LFLFFFSYPEDGGNSLLQTVSKKVLIKMATYIHGRTIKFANSPPCARHGSTGQKA